MKMQLLPEKISLQFQMEQEAVSTDQVVSNEPCHDVLGYSGIGSCFNPLREVINCYKDEAMPVAYSL